MQRQHGFGLIEVMLAFIIVAATAGALLQLNKIYLEYSRDGRSREVAMRLAESKLDELRRFQSRTGFDAIASGSDSVILDDIEYDRDWTVTDYIWDKDSCKSPNYCWVPSPSKKDTVKKNVTVLVEWEDVDVRQSFSLNSAISPNTPASSGPFGTSGDSFGSGKGGPKVVHTPGSFPEVLSISLGGGLAQETSKPMPKIIKQGNTAESVRVSFETAVYDSNNILEKKQDFVTVSCNCKLDNTVQQSLLKLPAQHVLSAGYIYWEEGLSSDKSRGVVANDKQDPLCQSCCKNHHDGNGNTFSNWYDAFKFARLNNPHGHYKISNHTQLASGTDEYLEACRMVRVDGFYEVAQDWNLVALNVMDDAFFKNKDFAPVYQAYVKKVVLDYVDKLLKENLIYDDFDNVTVQSLNDYLTSGGTQTSPYSTTNIQISPMARQLMARGVYIDLLSEDIRGFLKSKLEQGEKLESLLNYIPFYEVNLTLLAQWKPTSNDRNCVPYPNGLDVLCVTNEMVPSSTGNNKDGTYSRGKVVFKDNVVSGSKKVTAEIRRSNSGITTFKAISPLEDNYVRSSDITVEVGGFGDFSGKSSISSVLKCKTYQSYGDGGYEIISCSEDDFSKIILSAGDGSCVITPMVGNLEGFYNCFVKPNAGDVTLTAQYGGGKSFNLLPDNALVTVSDAEPSYIPGPCIAVVLAKPEGASLPGSCE